jgi:hypothetical protein
VNRAPQSLALLPPRGATQRAGGAGPTGVNRAPQSLALLPPRGATQRAGGAGPAGVA